MLRRQSLVLTVLILFSLAASADSKIKTRNSVMGHDTESTVYIKGARERTEGGGMGMGPSFVTIMQCDQKRVITLNPQANTCMVMPLGEESGAAPSAAAAPSSGSTRKGGTITFTVNTVDTGERQKILGLAARHIKSTMNAESSPDACSKTSLHADTDGWYADIAPAFSCGIGITTPPPRSSRPGCQDTVRFKRSGAGHPGYPLKQTMTMQAEGHSFTTTSEVIELTSTPLDASLFEMPAGCQVVSGYQELMGMGGMTGMTGGRPPMPRPPEAAPPPPAPEPPAPAPEPAAPAVAAAPPVAAKGAGVVRIGVVKINDSSGEYLPVDNLRVNLMSEVTLRQMEAVPLDADSAPAIAAEAADKQCDYILYTNAAQVKGPGSGGITLPAAVRGMSLSQDKYQALLDITLYRVGRPAPELKQAPIAADADQFGVNAVMAGFEKEANKVAEQVQKDRQPARPSRTTPAKKPATAKKPG